MDKREKDTEKKQKKKKTGNVIYKETWKRKQIESNNQGEMVKDRERQTEKNRRTDRRGKTSVRKRE